MKIFTEYFITAFIVLSICAAIFLAIRAIVLWYWRIDRIVDNQEKQIDVLKDILKRVSELEGIKKTLLVLVVMMSVSCADDETHCFKCTTAEAGQTTEFTRCDITAEEAAEIERAGTEIDPESSYPFGVVLKKHTVCVRAD